MINSGPILRILREVIWKELLKREWTEKQIKKKIKEDFS